MVTTRHGSPGPGFVLFVGGCIVVAVGALGTSRLLGCRSPAPPSPSATAVASAASGTAVASPASVASGGTDAGPDAAALADVDASGAAPSPPALASASAPAFASASASPRVDAAAPSAPAAPRAVTVDESQDGKTIDLARNQSLTVMLTASPTSGFDWAVVKAPPALGAPDLGFVSGGDAMGAPGKRRLTWTLKGALPAGEHGIELAYRRSFEQGAAPFKTFRLKVKAAP